MLLSARDKFIPGPCGAAAVLINILFRITLSLNLKSGLFSQPVDKARPSILSQIESAITELFIKRIILPPELVNLTRSIVSSRK